MVDRIFSGNDIVSGAGTKSITFTNPFKTVNYAVGITGQNMATGDYFLVENKTIKVLMLHLKIRVIQQCQNIRFYCKRLFKRSIRKYGTT